MTEFQFICLYFSMGCLLILMCCHPACQIDKGKQNSAAA